MFNHICFDNGLHSLLSVTPAYYHITLWQYHNMPSTFHYIKNVELDWYCHEYIWPKLTTLILVNQLQISLSPAIEPTTDPDTVANWLNDFKRITSIMSKIFSGNYCGFQQNLHSLSTVQTNIYSEYYDKIKNRGVHLLVYSKNQKMIVKKNIRK